MPGASGMYFDASNAVNPLAQPSGEKEGEKSRTKRDDKNERLIDLVVTLELTNLFEEASFSSNFHGVERVSS